MERWAATAAMLNAFPEPQPQALLNMINGLEGGTQAFVPAFLLVHMLNADDDESALVDVEDATQYR